MNSTLILAAVENHLWQSTLFALGAGGLTLLARRNSARVRYCLWLAASVKFLLPFALLTAAGALIPWPRWASLAPLDPTSGQAPPVLLTASAWAAPLMQPAAGRTALAHGAEWSGLMLPALGLLWLLGVITVAGLVLERWMRIAQALRASEPATVDFVIPVRWCAAHLEPAVVGIIRPVLLLPKGIEPRLPPEQLQAVLAHECCHYVWRDNLAAALHMLSAALFWFHPLIWWLGRRQVEERERACDEQVLTLGHRPESYAEGILAVCEHHIQSRLSCAAGAGGANLRKRIEAIMNNRMIERLSGIQKVVLAAAAGAAIAVPFAAGVLTSPQAFAQAGAPNRAASSTPLDFKDADIVTVAEAVGAATGKNFIISPEVHARVTMVTTTPLTPAALYQVFLSILEVYGFVAEPAGDVIKIVPDTNARQHPGLELQDIVTQVVDVRNDVSAMDLVPILRPVLPTSHLVAYPASNILIISGRAAIVGRMVAIIRMIDRGGDKALALINSGEYFGLRPASAVEDTAGAQVRTQVRHLRYASAAQVTPRLRGEFTDIVQQTSGGGASPAQGASSGLGNAAKISSIKMDEASNAVVITAPPTLMAAVNAVIDQLDAAPQR